MHPDGTAHGGSAILIKSKIRHHETRPYREDYFQATMVVVEDWMGPITISAVYSLPKHTIKLEQYMTFFKPWDTGSSQAETIMPNTFTRIQD